MAYSKELYRKVQNELNESRQRALDQIENRREQLFIQYPRLNEIDRSLNSLGIDLAKSIFAQPEKASQLKETFEKQAQTLLLEKETLLLTNGYPENYLTPSFSCSICEDTGKVDEKRCHCFDHRLKSAAFEEINALSHLSLCSFANFSLDFYPDAPDPKTKISPRTRMEQNFSYCQNYVKHFSPNSSSVLMIGQTGLGKTHLSLSIAREIIEAGYGVVYGSAPNLISKIEHEKFEQNKNSLETDTLKMLQHCDLLVLDDLGTEFQTKFTTAAIYDLLNTRLNLSLPTIVSTNLSLKELEDAYSPRILSRITGLYDILFFMGRDIRGLQ